MSLRDVNRPDAEKAIELALAKLEKSYGPNTVFAGSAKPMQVPVIPTGNFYLDLALGVGGLPRGRITEVFGAESLGKTLIALNTAARCQQMGGKVLYIDAECDLDPEWSTTLGVDMSSILLAQPGTGEEALEIVETMIRTGGIDLVVVDSVAALTPKAEVEGSMEDNHIGLQARMLAQGLRKLRVPIAESNTCLLFLNQIRDKIGFMQSGTTSPGGRALKFFSAIRIELKKKEELKSSSGEPLGIKINAKIIKNKVARPAVSIEYDILYGLGFNNMGSTLSLAERFGLISRKAAYYYRVGEEKHFAQGEAKAVEFLAENVDFYRELQELITKEYNG